MDNEAELKVIADLESQRKYWVDAITRANAELQRIEHDLRMRKGLTLFNQLAPDPAIEPTATGMLRGLAQAITELLTNRQTCMTASMIADALYSFNMNITIEKLTRRVSVTTSSMYKDHGEKPLLVDSKRKNERREIFWALPDWMEDGKLSSKYEPIKSNDSG